MIVIVMIGRIYDWNNVRDDWNMVIVRIYQ